ncbi:hypothetical protein GCM10009798_34740 [Nocardioides panacihumi]|uniref:DUF1353 domain-containing protein n=1 Tax=Nocardioides panacihumi TaxID=400774 RepID=A0ABN2RLQ9_9ACTN
MISDLQPQPHRFHDGGTASEPSDPNAQPRIVLERDVQGERELFRMLRRIAYLDEELGELLVPADLVSFRTDLTSVPALFTWLVPKTGSHLPPALLHDGLVGGGSRQEYVGRPMDRPTADRVFRRAMRDTHVGTVRRWLIWAAVTLATIHVGTPSWSRARHVRYLVAADGTLGLVGILGTIATLDLFDVVDWLPWMGDRPWWLELVGGLAGAVVIPLLLGLTWGRFAVAGAIAGIALAVLLHVTAALAVITLLYQAVERLARRTPLAVVVAGGVVVLSCAVLTTLLVASA